MPSANQPFVSSILPLHILAAFLALVCGYIALWASKGASLHRKSGMLFFFAMSVMSISGACIAYLTGSTTSVIGGLLTFYFVITGLLTVRPTTRAQEIHIAGLLLAVTVGILALATGFAMRHTGKPETIGMYIFGTISLLAAAGDLRILRNGPLLGRPHLRRHLWRMCFALFIAAVSFFLGPTRRIPELIRIPALLPIPVLVPLVAMFYWLWRTRAGKLPSTTAARSVTPGSNPAATSRWPL